MSIAKFSTDKEMIFLTLNHNINNLLTFPSNIVQYPLNLKRTEALHTSKLPQKIESLP